MKSASEALSLEEEGVEGVELALELVHSLLEAHGLEQVGHSVASDDDLLLGVLLGLLDVVLGKGLALGDVWRERGLGAKC